VDLANADGRLRTNTFGLGAIVLREEPKAIVIRATRFIGTGRATWCLCATRISCSRSPEDFSCAERAARGEGRRDDGDYCRAVAGRVIASKNSVVLEAQLLKSNMGPGVRVVRENSTFGRRISRRGAERAEKRIEIAK